MTSMLAGLLRTELPIILGPFGGLSSIELTSTVSNGGGLGSYGLYGYTAQRIQETDELLKGATDRSFAFNLWLPSDEERDPSPTDFAHARAAVAEIFAELERAFAESADGYVEFVTLLDRMCQQGRQITAFTVRATSVNINDRDSLFQAKFNERAVLFARRSIALLVYAEGHEQRVRFTLQRYRKVVDPAAIYLVVPADNTIATEAAELGVQVLTCPPEVTLYGEKLRYALDRIDHDLVILTEADYAFPGRDIDKLLAYVREADLVVGTRTTRQLIEQGSDLQELVRLANVFLAKLMEVLWWRFEGRFTDVGCTFRAIWMSSYRQMRGDLQARGAEFAVEMIVEALDRRMRVIEIPVNYRNISRSLYRKYRNRRTFFRILRLLFVKRFCRDRRSRPVST